MKLKAPEGCCSFSHGGVDVVFNKDGTVDVTNNPQMVAVMMDHGFTDAAAEVTAPVTVPSRKSARRSAE